MEKKSNNVISYKGNSNTKGIIIEGHNIVSPITFTWAVHAACDEKGNVEVKLPSIPKSVTKKYSELNNYNYIEQIIVSGFTFANNSKLSYYDYLKKSYSASIPIIYMENALFSEWKYDDGFLLIGQELK